MSDLIERLCAFAADDFHAPGVRKAMRQAAEEIERLRDALEIVAESIYCCDGYRNVSISEEAEQAVINALKERDDA